MAVSAATALAATTVSPPKPLDLLVVYNGTLAGSSKGIGGGDQVMLKCINLSGIEPDILIPRSAQALIQRHGRLFFTMANWRLDTLGILVTFPVRVLQGVWHGWRQRHTYEIAVAVSGFAVDLIPLWFWKARRKGAIVYHVIPERKAVNFATRLRFGLAALEQRLALRMLRHVCDYMVAGNEVTKRQLQAFLPGKPVFVLHAGFDAAALDRVASIPKDGKLALFIGRLTSQKGIFDLVKLMAEIRQEDPEFRLVMVGHGPDRDFLLAEIQRLQLNNITLAGFITDEEKMRLLKQAAFFFFPSYEEGWGIALAEALYCECRCVTYELEHYRPIFRDYPAYARLGDWQDFLRAFREVRPRSVAADQKSFLRQYNDPMIARQFVEHLKEIAAASH